MTNRVELTVQLAQFIFDQARILIGVGVGETEVGVDLGYEGELDNIPAETETHRWADACIKLIKYIAVHLGPAISDYYQREGRDAFEAQLLTLTDIDENSEQT